MGVIAPVVHDISGISLSTPLATWVNRDISYDYAIGGLPFLSASDQQFPFERRLERKTAPYIKQQIDQTTEPGEQTLVNWWLRSQSSFHAGTGIIYEEPTGLSGDLIPYRFQDAEGVDVWTPGQVSLLPKAAQVYSSTNITALIGAGNNRAVLLDGTTLKVISLPTGTQVGGDITGKFGPLATDGINWYAVGPDGIHRGTLDGAGITDTKIWDLPSTGGIAALAWVKDRLMMATQEAAGGGKVYELAGGSPPTLPAPVYETTSIAFTSISESPQAIYVAGNDGERAGRVLMFTLDTSGLVPILSGGFMAAELPENEIISCIYGYLGAYLAIGTSRGVRVAEVQPDGSLQYGPLTDITPKNSFSSVDTIVGVDRFLYGSLTNGFNDGSSGLFRIDLGSPLGFRQFAWAKDLKASSGSTNSVTGSAVYSDPVTNLPQVAFCVSGNGVFCPSDADSVASGFLTTGNIRFHMLESKLFKYVHVFTKPFEDGAVSITATNEDGTIVPLGIHGDLTGFGFLKGLSGVKAKDPFPNQYGPHEWVSLTFTLTAIDAGHNNLANNPPHQPTMTGYQLTALPAQKRQRIIVLPLQCYDLGSDSKGIAVGYEGRALEMIRSLEALEEAGDIVQFDDLTVGGGPPRQVLIDDITFIQGSRPSTDANSSGWGGVMVVTLRAVD